MGTPKPYTLVPETHETLLSKAKLVDHVDEWMCKRLIATVRHHGGLAIAAPQVGIGLALIVLNDGRVLANPIISHPEGEQVGPEGCLSLPGRFWNVTRAESIEVQGYEPFSNSRIAFQADGLDSRVFQHENDHLNGLLLSRFPDAEIFDEPIGEVL